MDTQYPIIQGKTTFGCFAFYFERGTSINCVSIIEEAASRETVVKVTGPEY